MNSEQFKLLTEPKPWKALQRAEDAAFEAQREFERNGFAADHILAARRRLTDANNQLRQHFETKSVDKAGD